MIISVSEFRNIISSDKNIPICRKKNIDYINLSLAFDIETSSCYRLKNTDTYISNDDFQTVSDKGKKMYEKIAFMYIWQFGYKGYQVIGRKWCEFEQLINILHTVFQTEYNKKHVVIYIHNLSYEFQFICRRFNFAEVFAIKERKPIKAITDNGIEFRCSYLLSGYSLAVLANNLTSHKIKKMVGDLDYSLIRNCNTELSDLELSYCVNDILIVQYYIEECIDRFGNIALIPNTQTGIVRSYVKKYIKNCKSNYMRNIQSMKLDSESFKSLKRAFQGGFTHGNIFFIGREVNEVFSVDFTSSYPYCLVSEKYPMSSPVRVNESVNCQMLDNFFKSYLCVFDLTLKGVKSKYNINILPSHKCYVKHNAKCDNGKIIEADKITITVTNIDFNDIKFFYSFSELEISNLYLYKKDYLPKEFTDCVFKFYNDKTQLKAVDGKEAEYLHSKEMLNSLYGMCVTDIIRDNITFTSGKWEITSPLINDKINEYNNDKSRFLYYAWGVFCTAYARHNLFSGLKEMITDTTNDYVYCDTDSIKGINYNKHKYYFDSYNRDCEEKLVRMCNAKGYDKSILYPKTIKGNVKLMGVWDYEGEYSRFKTLGAKRYLVEKNGKCYMTVSGLGKKSVDYIGETNDDKFNNFSDGLALGRNETSKMTHTYCDYSVNGVIRDFNGIKGEFSEKSFIHLENADFQMRLSGDFSDLIFYYSKMIDRRL